MAFVLSLRPQSPMKRSFSDNPHLHSCSPLPDAPLSALRDITPRNASACSLFTLGSNKVGDWLRGAENTPPPLTSRSLLDLVPEKDGLEADVWNTAYQAHAGVRGIDRPATSSARIGIPSYVPPDEPKDIIEPFDSGRSSPETMAVDANQEEPTGYFELFDAMQIPLPEGRYSDNTGSEAHEEEDQGEDDESVTAGSAGQPFRRWMSTLRRRHILRRKDNVTEVRPWSMELLDSDDSALPRLPQMPEPHHAKSDSMTSSLDCLTRMKSASITVASTTVAPRSDTGGLHCKIRLGNRSSNYSDARRSTDSHRGTLGPIIDESAWLRSLQRRKIVEEIITSEEGYIADLKVLINDYFMILTAVPAIPHQTRTAIQQNIAQILQLHEDLLAELHQAVPQADLAESLQTETYPATKAKHIRFHSADMIPGRAAENRVTRKFRHSLEIGRSPDRRSQGLVADTKTVGHIAKIFNKHMKRFFAYEEYGAHWTTMSQDLTATCKGLHGWQEYERGVEALSKVVASENSRDSSSRKALSFADLLIKPIQRVCKYPLLFDDLCRHTPVYDDPETHAELEKALFRLQETIKEVNKAKDDPQTRRLIEISWQLQDRLVFQEHTLSRALTFRLLGHVLVCGVLHVAYQTPERIKGQYMVCALYRSCLVLATTNRLYTPYHVVAAISLANGSIEEADNGRGIQCHTAPHTWKLVFEHGHRLHEVILSACSSQEEEIWKHQIRQRIASETHDFVEGQSTMQDMFSSLSLDIKSIGPVFGHADSLVRRMSVHRAATLGSKTNMAQVIIKNTQAQKTPEPPPPFAPTLVTRSQSHMSANHVPTLAPRRAERIRLETAMEDVWTKDVLPFPGIANRRVEDQIRASANSVMRKLSMASIASNFSRRSPSYSSISNARSDDSSGSKAHKGSQGTLRDRRPAPTVVDFHNAPAAFLPADFEVEDTRPTSRHQRFGDRAGSISSSERSLPGKPKRTRRLSGSVISLPRTDAGRGVDPRPISKGSSASTSGMNSSFGDTVSRPGSERQRKGSKDGSSHSASGSTPPAKKFLKSKSKIFKFWI